MKSQNKTFDLSDADQENHSYSLSKLVFYLFFKYFCGDKKTRDEKPNQLHHWTINRRPLCWLSIGLKKVV